MQSDVPSCDDFHPITSLPPVHIGYQPEDATSLLADNTVLAVISFGAGESIKGTDARHIHIGLDPIGPTRNEVWRVQGPVRQGRASGVAWSSDGDYLFFHVEIDEDEAGGPAAAAEQAYARISALIAGQAQACHVLRLWNYLDAINEGEGDAERYRHFCIGRAQGLGAAARNGFSAATAIGRRDGRRVLQVYGLAARTPGAAVENPRQQSAWTYPRQYGPVPPTFARATRTAAGQLLVSGTAAVVGHATVHGGDTLAQLDETLRNLDSLMAAAGEDIAARGLGDGLLKVYLRHAEEADAVRQRLREREPGLGEALVLCGDICRADLRIEIDGILGRL